MCCAKIRRDTNVYRSDTSGEMEGTVVLVSVMSEESLAHLLQQQYLLRVHPCGARSNGLGNAAMIRIALVTPSHTLSRTSTVR